MIYDKLPVALLSALSAEGSGTTNAQIARYLLVHADMLDDLSVRELASACHVGTGTISRFAKEVGFESFGELRGAFREARRSYEPVGGASAQERTEALLARTVRPLVEVARSVDQAALARLVDDLASYEHLSAFGLLKAQAAALDLQVDLLMLGKYVETCVSLAEQLDHIAHAGSDELVLVFSYTGSYFDTRDLATALRRLDRPKVWMVCGCRPKLPPYVADCLSFSSSLDQFGHPYQLQLVSSLIAQELAARLAGA